MDLRNAYHKTPVTRTEPNTQILRVSAVIELWRQKNVSNFGNKRISLNVANKRRFRTMDLRNDYDKTPICKNRTGEKELSLF